MRILASSQEGFFDKAVVRKNGLNSLSEIKKLRGRNLSFPSLSELLAYFDFTEHKAVDFAEVHVFAA
jgi:hypothetical protein